MMKEDALAKLIGWNINALLLQNDKTQQELADYLGVGPFRGADGNVLVSC